MVLPRIATCQAAILALLASCVQGQLPPAPAPGPLLGTGGDTVALAVQDGSCAGNGTFQVLSSCITSSVLAPYFDLHAREIGFRSAVACDKFDV